MNKMKYLALAFVAVMGFTACGDDKEDNNQSGEQKGKVVPSTELKTIDTTMVFKAEAFHQTIVLNRMAKSEIVTAGDSWAKMTLVPYESGYQQVDLELAANDSVNSRSTLFVLKSADTKLNLTILQNGMEQKPDPKVDPKEESDVTTTTDEVSNQPAMSRR